MAIAAACVWEVRTTATAGNVNGGFYKTGASGTDFSQQDAAQYNLTGGTSAGAGAVILHASAAADMVGNGLHINSGTNTTAGWYEIISVIDGVSITVDRNCTTGVGASIAFRVGGALVDGVTGIANQAVAGNTAYVKAGTYTVSGGNNWNWGVLAGTSSVQGYVIGYNATRGDNPTGSNRPQVNFSSGTFLTGSLVTWKNMSFKSANVTSGQGAAFISTGNGSIYNCKFVNTTTTANIQACGVTNNINFYGCEFVSYNGYGVVQPSADTASFFNCWFHDSQYGIFNSYTAAPNRLTVQGCTFSGCAVAGYQSAASSALYVGQLINNTFYGGEASKIGIGINYLGNYKLNVLNNIFYGLATGLVAGVTANEENNNNYFNNTADVSGISKGANDIALDPQFTSVGQYKHTGTVTSSGTTLTDTGAAFTNVTAGRDFLLVTASTGGNTGIFGISSKTATTVTDNSLGTGSAITYSIIWGQNFAVGTNMKAVGDANTGNPNQTAYVDIGAVQRQAVLPSAADLRLGTVVDTVTGTLAGSKAGTFVG